MLHERRVTVVKRPQTQGEPEVTLEQGTQRVLDLIEGLQRELVLLQSQCVGSKAEGTRKILEGATGLMGSLSCWQGNIEWGIKKLEATT